MGPTGTVASAPSGLFDEQQPPHPAVTPGTGPGPGDQPRPVVLSYGLGVDSSAILLRWLTEPASRDFALDRLIVVTAMTGDEFADTGRLVTTHVLPRLREAGVRFVQLARRGPKVDDGVAVLGDTRSPTEVHLEGAWKLSDELRAAGTVPQVASGRRTCSIKFKGWPIDTFLAAELGGQSFRHVMGFNADELRRAERDESYSSERRASEYPLVEWGWGRERCESYLEDMVGEPWLKSACSFCPFSRDHHQGRYVDNTEAAADAMLMELSALALNPRSTIFARHSLIEEVTRTNPAATEAYHRRLAASTWAVYEVRRIMFAKGVAWRSVRTLVTADHPGVAVELARLAAAHRVGVTSSRGGLERVSLEERSDTVYPSRERFFVAAPVGVADKERLSFARRWDELAPDRVPDQAPLFAA